MNFLDNYAMHATAIYILGDFFAVWLGDDVMQAWEQEIQQRLLKLANAGVAIYIMHGNRDFLLGEAFITACKATLITEPYKLELYGTPAVLFHGDVLCTLDKNYQWLRWVVRNQVLQCCFLWLPLKLRQLIAARLRRSSREVATNVVNIKTDATETAIDSAFAQHQVPVLIHGHTHHPAINWRWQHNSVYLRIVLSDWDKRGNMLHCTPDRGFRLRYF